MRPLRALLTMGLAMAAPIYAQTSNTAHAPSGRQRPLQLRPIAPGVYWSKEGGNVGVVIGLDGVVLYDVTGSPERAAELRARLAEITDKPIKAIIISHVDEDHVGGLRGFPATIPVIAQKATRDRIRVEAPKTGIPIPGIAVARRRTMMLGGEKVELLNWGDAHTSGDLVAWFPRLGVVMAADMFCMDQPRPYIKPELGGNSLGWLRSVRAILALHPQWIVVGHGEPQRPGNLRAYVADSARERGDIARLAARGISLPEIERQVGEPQPSTVPTPPGAHLAQFAKVVYGEVTGAKGE